MVKKHKMRLILGLTVVTSVCYFGWPRSLPESLPCSAPTINVYKTTSELEVTCNGTIRYVVPVTFGANPKGAKQRQGDERTPEGEYMIAYKKQNFLRYRFLGLSYPNRADRKNARRHNIMDPGDGVGIHGGPAPLALIARVWIRGSKITSFSQFWGPTDGCILVPNEDADLLYRIIPLGTPVRVLPRPPTNRKALN